MAQIVECVPNFSEARRPEVIDRIAAAIGSIEGARLLDRSSDLDHNRTVLTMAGDPAAIEEAAFQTIKVAAELIDMSKHTGAHPRIGATDVVPFVPISGISMDECVAMARRLGQRVGEQLQVPVYLYEFAATRPDRTNLENIRRGQYEALRAEIATNPDRIPDFGPRQIGLAGATVIGARNPLIAFNVYLATGEVEIAKKIARAIRYSSGGLRSVKALGLLVEGRAQVSINLTNFRESPVGRVVELIRREASRYGTAVHHSELVGLIPQEALVDAAVWYTQLDNFSSAQILESRLYELPSVAGSAQPAASFIDEVAAATAAPGGGSVAALAGALGAALVEMVAGLTIGKSKYQEVEPEMLAVRVQAHRLRAELSQAVEDDAAAFEAVMGAYKLPKSTQAATEARQNAISRAMMNAAHVPLHTAEAAVQVMELAARCARDGNVNAISDAVSGASMARAALTAAGYNVRINLYGMTEDATAEQMLSELSGLGTRAEAADRQIQEALAQRAKLA
ncbi:MAG TPA: glutamate formimidoyltransferase [Anaerolineales bacterium]